MTQKPVIFLEFNELCPHLLDRWMAEGKLPNFKRFYEASAVFTTEADVDDPINLEPWIQWYSIHTGLSYDQHKVFRLTDGPRGGHDDIWQVLARQGRPVGNCSSMNARRIAGDQHFFISDPWCNQEDANPTAFQIFQDFVAAQVQEHANPDRPMGVGAAANFLIFMLRHGLRPQTIARILARLAAEMTTDRGSGWKRAALLDALQFDLFRYCFQRYRPDFSTFFINSTAHYQHAYWRHMDPDAFAHKPSQDEVDRYGAAILYGYQRMNDLMGSFMELEKQGATLMFATALSQKPFLKFEAIGGQRFYRPRDVSALLQKAGISHHSVEPVMTHQFMLRTDPAEREQAAEQLRRMTLQGQPIMQIELRGEDAIYFGCQLRQTISQGAALSLPGSNGTVPFEQEFFLIADIKSGCHHPDGALWIKTGQHHKAAAPVSILDIYPTLLNWFGVPDAAAAEDGMTRQGRIIWPPQDASGETEWERESTAA